MFPPDSKILIVDDMKGIRMWLLKSLQTLGFSNIAEAGNGEEALAYLRQNQVDLMFTDLVMPVMGGVNLIKEMHQVDSLKAIPVIVLTSESDKKMIVEVIGLGVNSYIIKPATLPVIQKKIEAIYAAKKAQGA